MKNPDIAYLAIMGRRLCSSDASTDCTDCEFILIQLCIKITITVFQNDKIDAKIAAFEGKLKMVSPNRTGIKTLPFATIVPLYQKGETGFDNFNTIYELSLYGLLSLSLQKVLKNIVELLYNAIDTWL